MNTKHSLENWLRPPWEFCVAVASGLVASTCFLYPSVLGLTRENRWLPAASFLGLCVIRSFQGLRIWRYQQGLLQRKTYCLSTDNIPHSKTHFFVGMGFLYRPQHRQRLNLLTQPQYERYRRPSKLYRALHAYLRHRPNSIWGIFTYLPGLKPMPDIGGKPWLHGVGAAEEKPFWLSQSERNGHMLVLGKTRVGKTRLLSILVNQDIQNGEAVIVVDPKGDLSLLQEMYAAAKSAKRLHEFHILHAGCPEWSAKYNPLQAYTDIAEVTERVTSAIDASGEGKQFKDFAWKYLNLTAMCLAEMRLPINYKSLGFFVMRPNSLLNKFALFRLQQWYPDIETTLKEVMLLNTVIKKDGSESRPSRDEAILLVVKARMDAAIKEGDMLQLNREPLFDVYEAANTAQDYYKKITASLGPVFDKINKTQAHGIFSGEATDGLPVIDWENVVKTKRIVYVGLDSLTNQAMSEAIGKALISDLVSMFGRFQRDGIQKCRTLCCYFDELSEILPESFVRLLNKAGGVGAQVIAFSQTINDIAGTLGNHDKANMLIGNFGILAMLRIANRETAQVFTECLEKIRTRNLVPSSQVQDKSSGKDGNLFITVNSDTVTEETTTFITENDVFSLPIGELFLVSTGGNVAKVRIPFASASGHPPETLEEMCAEVNYA